MSAPTPPRRATTTATGSERTSRSLPAGTNAGLWAFLGQAGRIGIGAAALGFLATLAVYGLQLAGWLS